MIPVFLLLFLIQTIFSLQTTPPTWKTSIYFRAGQESVINTLTGNSSTPQYTFVFSSALSGTPNIAYGISKYQGADTLLDECFQIFRIGLSSTSFSVAVQITGFTNLYLLRVAYLAIQPTFPHHLNTFDNIPVNYSRGPLSNLTTRSASQTTYLNTINYTQQSTGRKYTNFTTPISRYKIVLMMTSLFVSTQKETAAGQNFSMDLRIQPTILSEETYQIYVKLKVSVIVNRLHFSEIVFDPVDIQSSYKYKLLYELWTLNNFGGQKMIPQQFKDNFIMGLTQFTSKLGYCGFDYMWDWLSSGSFFGVKISESITRANLCAFVRMSSSVVYIQAWQCLAPYYYYNHTTGNCQDECGMYFYPTQKMVDIEMEYNCEPCDWACSKCNSSQKCLSCNSDDMRLFNGSCYCPNGYVDTLTVTKCQPCLDPKCIMCEKNPNYKSNPLPNDPITTGMSNICVLCDQGYILNDTTKACNPWAKCNSSNNELLNYDTNVCEVCLLSGCSQCRQSMQIKFNGTIADVMQVGATTNRILAGSSPYGVVSCGLCDEANQFFKNMTTRNCEKCTLTQCINCSSLYTCVQCNALNQYFMNDKTKTCQKCTLQGCINCYNLTTCRTCDAIKGYFLVNDTKLCKFCALGCSDCQFSSTGSNASPCKGCSPGLVFIDGKCSCNKGQFLEVINSKNVGCSPCDPLCKQCENSSLTCTACYFQQNRVLSAKGNKCQCSSSNYVQNLSSLVCSKKDSSIPDIGYTKNLSSGQVQQICGDGVRLVLECDDGNLINKDGCSKECKIEENFVCKGAMYEISVCQYTGNISIAHYNVTKDPFDNLLELSLQMIPELVIYQFLDWQSGLYFGGSTQIYILSAYMKTSDVLYVKAKYNQNIKNLYVTLGYNLSKQVSQILLTKSSSSSLQNSQQPSPITRSTNSISFSFIETQLDFTTTTNNLEVAYYPENTYSTVKFFELIFTIIMIIYVGLVLGALFLFKRIVPVMVVFVSIQLCFVSLSSIQNFQPQTFSIINNFDEVFGINNMDNQLTQCSHDDISPVSFKNLKFKGCFASNLNLMVVFEIVAIFGTITMAIVELFWLQKLGKKYGGLFKRCLCNLVIFNLSNAGISAGIMQFKHMTLVDIGIISSQVLLTIVHLILMLKFKKTYFIQVEIADFEDKMIQDPKQNDKDHENSSSKDEKSERQQNSQNKSAPDALQQIHSKKESNQEAFSGSLSAQEQRKLEESDNQQKENQKPQPINKQIVYFVMFITSIGIVCPAIYFLSSQKYPLFCNIAVMVVIIILIILHIALKPFLVSSEPKDMTSKTQQTHKKEDSTYFTLLSVNYIVSYGWIFCFLAINVLFSTLEQSYNQDAEKKVNVMSILSYGQVITFLLMISYLLIAWGYSAYLSFFDQDVLIRYYKDQQQSEETESDLSIENSHQVSESNHSKNIVSRQENEQNIPLKGRNSQSSSMQESESSSIAQVLNKYRIRQSSIYTGPTGNLRSTLSHPYETMDYDNEFMPTPKPQRRKIIHILQDSENLIFEMDEDSVQEERF